MADVRAPETSDDDVISGDEIAGPGIWTSKLRLGTSSAVAVLLICCTVSGWLKLLGSAPSMRAIQSRSGLDPKPHLLLATSANVAASLSLEGEKTPDYYMLGDESDCQPSATWLGVKNSADECAVACRHSEPSAGRFVWAGGEQPNNHGDKNCKCASSSCTRKTWDRGILYQYVPGPESHLLNDNMDCQPSSQWLGHKKTVDQCAKSCRDSDPSAGRFVWAKHGDTNCKCASSSCTTSSWSKGAVYEYVQIDLKPKIPWNDIPDIKCSQQLPKNGTCEAQKLACQLLKQMWDWDTANVNISMVKRNLSGQCFGDKDSASLSDDRFTSCPQCPDKTYWSIDAADYARTWTAGKQTHSECSGLCAAYSDCDLALIQPDSKLGLAVGTCHMYALHYGAKPLAGCTAEAAHNAGYLGYIKIKPAEHNPINVNWNCDAQGCTDLDPDKYQTCAVDAIKYMKKDKAASQGMKAARAITSTGLTTVKEITKIAVGMSLGGTLAFSFVSSFVSAFFPKAGDLPANPCAKATEDDWGKCVWEAVKPFVQKYVSAEIDKAFAEFWQADIRGFQKQLLRIKNEAFIGSKKAPNGTVIRVPDEVRTRMYDDLHFVYRDMINYAPRYNIKRNIDSADAVYISMFAGLHVSVMSTLFGSWKYRTAADRNSYQTYTLDYSLSVLQRALLTRRTKLDAIRIKKGSYAVECNVLFGKVTCACDFEHTGRKEPEEFHYEDKSYQCNWKKTCKQNAKCLWNGRRRTCGTCDYQAGCDQSNEQNEYNCHRAWVQKQSDELWQNWLTPIPDWIEIVKEMHQANIRTPTVP